MLCCNFSLQGSGKSTLSQAFCRKAREELDAHVEVVDCKKLQGQERLHEYLLSEWKRRIKFNCFVFLLGKRVETVRQNLMDIFEQAEWRQPSVVLLDDLDCLTRAPASPEHEHGPEALLQQHIAQSKIFSYLWECLLTDRIDNHFLL